MKKQHERAPAQELPLRQHTFTRQQRTWQHVAVFASGGFAPRLTRKPKGTGAPTWSDDTSWILRQRLN
jgi:hypothetical protein